MRSLCAGPSKIPVKCGGCEYFCTAPFIWQLPLELQLLDFSKGRFCLGTAHRRVALALQVEFKQPQFKCWHQISVRHRVRPRQIRWGVKVSSAQFSLFLTHIWFPETVIVLGCRFNFLPTTANIFHKATPECLGFYCTASSFLAYYMANYEWAITLKPRVTGDEILAFMKGHMSFSLDLHPAKGNMIAS